MLLCKENFLLLFLIRDKIRTEALVSRVFKPPVGVFQSVEKFLLTLDFFVGTLDTSGIKEVCHSANKTANGTYPFCGSSDEITLHKVSVSRCSLLSCVKYFIETICNVVKKLHILCRCAKGFHNLPHSAESFVYLLLVFIKFLVSRVYGFRNLFPFVCVFCCAIRHLFSIAVSVRAIIGNLTLGFCNIAFRAILLYCRLVCLFVGEHPRFRRLSVCFCVKRFLSIVLFRASAHTHIT